MTNKKLAFLIYITFLTLNLTAQSSLFSTVENLNELSPQAQGKLDQYLSDPTTNVVAVAKVNPIRDAVDKDGDLSIDFQPLATPLQYKITSGASTHKDRIWYGNNSTSSDNDNSDGSSKTKGEFLYYKTNSENFGYFTHQNTLFQFMHLHENYVVIIKIDNAGNASCAIGAERGDHSFSSEVIAHSDGPIDTIAHNRNTTVLPKNNNADDPCKIANATVRVLFAYTSNADTDNDDIEDLATLSFGQLRSALLTSGIDRERLSIELAGIVPISFTETNDINDDVAALTSDLQQLRSTKSADVVIVLTRSYTNFAGAVLSPTVEVDFDNYLAVVGESYAIPRNVVAHEFGHLLGIRHGNDAYIGFEKGYRIKVPGPDLYTAVYALNVNNTALSQYKLMYSTPKRFVSGKRAGKVNMNDARKKMEGIGPTVANYFSNPPIFTPNVTITGNTSFCSNQSSQLTASTVCMDGSINYVWERSTDMVNFNTVSTNSSYFYTAPNIPYNSTKNEMIRVTATNYQTSVSTSVVAFIQNGAQCGGSHFSNKNVSNVDGQYTKVTDLATSNIMVYPNPISNGQDAVIQISREDLHEGESTIHIVNRRGEKVLDAASTEEIRSNDIHLRVPTRNLPTGLYYAVLINSKGNNRYSSFVIK